MTGAEAAVIAGAVGGGRAVLAAGLATFGTYKATDRSVRAQAGREREQRLAEAYIDLTRLIYTVMTRVEVTRPKVMFKPPPDTPASISAPDQIRIMSRIRALGSEGVRGQLDAWQKSSPGSALRSGSSTTWRAVPIYLNQPMSHKMTGIRSGMSCKGSRQPSGSGLRPRGDGSRGTDFVSAIGCRRRPLASAYGFLRLPWSPTARRNEAVRLFDFR